MGKQSKNKGGRPPLPVDQKVADEICEWIRQGKTLREFCRQPDRPNWRTVYDWLEKDERFAARFARARDDGHEVLAQECQQIADENCIDQVDVQRNRLRIETRLKLLAKWNPKKWGDRQVMDHNGSVNISVITGVPPRDGNPAS